MPPPFQRTLSSLDDRSSPGVTDIANPAPSSINADKPDHRIPEALSSGAAAGAPVEARPLTAAEVQRQADQALLAEINSHTDATGKSEHGDIISRIREALK